MNDALARADLEGAELPQNEHALLEFVGLLTKHAHQTTRHDVQQLRDVGWNDEEIAECVYITSLFALFNRVADAFGLQDPGYRELARVGKAPKPAERGRAADRSDI